jgi:hypothetical protein
MLDLPRNTDGLRPVDVTLLGMMVISMAGCSREAVHDVLRYARTRLSAQPPAPPASKPRKPVRRKRRSPLDRVR